jgi:hypothetical protein
MAFGEKKKQIETSMDRQAKSRFIDSIQTKGEGVRAAGQCVSRASVHMNIYTRISYYTYICIYMLHINVRDLIHTDDKYR